MPICPVQHGRDAEFTTKFGLSIVGYAGQWQSYFKFCQVSLNPSIKVMDQKVSCRLESFADYTILRILLCSLLINSMIYLDLYVCSCCCLCVITKKIVAKDVSQPLFSDLNKI